MSWRRRKGRRRCPHRSAQVCCELVTGPKTKTALAKALCRNDTDIEDALVNLFATHAIEQVWRKVKGIKRKHFQLRVRA